MKCDKCGSPNVVSKIVIQGNKNVDELNLCPLCFKTFVKDHPEMTQGNMGKSLNEFLLGTLNLLNTGFQLKNENPIPQNAVMKQCPNCSTPSIKIIREGTVGCAQCYSFFQNEIDEYFLKHFGVNRKLQAEGQIPKKQLIDNLNKKLEDAIKTENYEIAALVRDELKSLK